MGSALEFGSTIIKVRETFDGGDRVLVRQSPTIREGIIPMVPIYWEGWAWQERLHKWIDPDSGTMRIGWLDTGKWKLAEILATRFNEGPRWYEVWPHHAVRGIILLRGDRAILKILSRPAVGNERRTQRKKEGQNLQPRFTLTTPQLLLPPKGIQPTLRVPF